MTTATRRMILIADPRPDVGVALSARLRNAGFEVTVTASVVETQNAFYADPPHCMLIRFGMTSGAGQNLLKILKSDNVYGHLPAIVIVTPEELAGGIDWMSVPADDFVVDPVDGDALLTRIHMCWSRAQRDFNANPLTGLPGNLTISREAERRLGTGEDLAFAYMDLDGFKSFNDSYGFARGDEILRMTARVLVNTVRSVDQENSYVGHVGGDDFVFITPPGAIAHACEAVIAAFDAIVPDFYDDGDRKRGGIQSTDRQGNPKWCPIVTCSIGAVDTRISHIKHVGDLFGRVAEVKDVAKKLQASRFVVDRRQ